MKVFTIIILLLNFYGLRSIENDSLSLVLDCQGIKKMMASPKKFGIVVGDKTGTILTVSENNGVLEISYRMNSRKETVYAACSNIKDLEVDKEIIFLQFNADGTAFGKNRRGDDVFILLGEESTDSKVIARTRSKGQNFTSVSMNMVTTNRLPGHDAPTWYYYEEPNYVQISFVFPVGFVHPSYGPQNHVRVFVFREQNGKWSGLEDNSSVGF